MVKYTVWLTGGGEITKFTRELNTYGVDQGCKSSGRAGLSGPAQLKSRAVTARPEKILERNGPAQLKS